MLLAPGNLQLTDVANYEPDMSETWPFITIHAQLWSVHIVDAQST